MFQLAYRCAYRMMRVYWAVRRPDTHGALVAVWHDGKILLIRNSYVPYFSLPGGYVRAGESGEAAACRELDEEIGVQVRPEALRRSVDITHDWEGKRDHVEIFELDVTESPRVEIDNREVIAAGFYSPDHALRLDLFPPIRQHIEQRLAHASSGSNRVA